MENGSLHQLFTDPVDTQDASLAQLNRMRELLCYLLSKNQELRMELSAFSSTWPIEK